MNAAAAPLWTAAELVGAVRGAASAPLPAEISGVSIDSRTLNPGDLFIALSGPNHDGHAHVAAALARGAAAAIVARMPEGLGLDAPLILVDDTQTALERLGDAGRLRTRAKIAAITGSVGKTGTKEALGHALAVQGSAYWSVGSFNNHWGVPLSLARLPRDTDYAVFELGMNHAGEITGLTRQVRPDIAVITTIEPAHLEFFAGIEAIADAKAEIFLGMSGAGTAILNRDNAMFERLNAAAEQRGVQHIIPFGSHETAKARLISVDLGPDSSLVRARIGARDVAYRLSQPGRHLVINSLAVLAAVKAMGADLDEAAQALGQLDGLAGRGKRVTLKLPHGEAILIDESYNASPAAMRAALDVLSRAPIGPAGRRIAVLGDMRELGPTGPDLHRDLAGPLAAAGIDLVFACGPLMQNLFEALPAATRGDWAPTAAELAPVVTAAIRAGDAVTIKGSLGSRMADIVKPLTAGV